MRPVSPFLSMYKPQMGSTFSILESMTGMVLLVSLIFGLFLLTGKETMLTSYNFYYFLFFFFKGSFGSFLSGGFMFFLILSFVYHLLFGLRYILWTRTGGLDSIFPLDLEGLYKVSYYMGGLTIVVSLFLFFMI